MGYMAWERETGMNMNMGRKISKEARNLTDTGADSRIILK
jgi:hypothetical protein